MEEADEADVTAETDGTIEAGTKTEAGAMSSEGGTGDERRGNDYRVDIDGDARGSVVVGDHNLLVDAQHGSSVTLLVQGQRPVPVRRDQIALLPRRQQELVGRAAELAALDQGIRDGGLVQLYGPSGSGTSMLLRHAAHRLAPAPDGLIYLNAADREVADLAQEIFEACYDAVGYAPSATELRRLMAGVRVAVYLDNADLTREQTLALADMVPDAALALASHGPSLLTEDGALVELAGLDRAAGLKLLVRALQRPLAEDELDTATSLWQAAQGRPLHLLHAAALTRLRSPDARLPLPGEVAELLPLLLDGLDDPSTSVLRLLATLDGAELARTHIGALTELPDAARVCEQLAELGLLRAEQYGYRCAQDVVAAVLDRAPGLFPVEAICAHLADWLAQPGTTAAEVAAHSVALDRAATLAEAAGRPELAVRISRAASPAMARSLRFRAWGKLLGRGWSAAQRAEDKQAETFFVHEEGIRSLLTGRRVIAAALLGEAALLWKALGDLHGATAALNAQHFTPALTNPLPAPAPGLPGTAPLHTAPAHGLTGTTPAHAAPAHGLQSHSVASHMANLSPAPSQSATTAAVPHAAGHGAAQAAHPAAGHAGAGHGTAQAAHHTAAHTVANTSTAAGGVTTTAAAATTATAAGFAGGKALLIAVAVLVVGTTAAVTITTTGGSGGGGGAGGSKGLRAPFDSAVEALAQAPGLRYQGDWNVKEYLNDVTVTAHGEEFGTSHLTESTLDTDQDAQDLLSVGGKDYSRWHAADSAAGDLHLWTYDDLGDRDSKGSSRLTQEMSLYPSPSKLAKKFTQALADQPRLPSAENPQTTDINGVPALRADTTVGYLYVSKDAPYRVLRWKPPSALGGGFDPRAPLPRAMEARTPLSDTTSMDLTPVAPTESDRMYNSLEQYTKDLTTARYGTLDFNQKEEGSGVNCDSDGCHVKETVSSDVLANDSIVRNLGQVDVVMTVGSLDIDGHPAGTCSSERQTMQVSGNSISGTLTCDDPAGGAVYDRVSAESQHQADANGTDSYWDHAEDITIEALVLKSSEVDQLLANERQEQAAR